ncbi:hypothetical protein VTO73DRAFT_9608 [Trametes versicolor]
MSRYAHAVAFKIVDTLKQQQKVKSACRKHTNQQAQEQETRWQPDRTGGALQYTYASNVQPNPACPPPPF